MAEGQYEQARVRIVEMLTLARARHSVFLIADALHFLADIALRQGDLRLAEALLEESIGHARRIGVDVSGGLTTLGWTVLRQGGRPARVAALLAEALPLSGARERHDTLVACLGGLACVAALGGDAERATRLAGAGEAWREAHAVPLVEAHRRELDRTVAAAREKLGDAAFAAAWSAGRGLPLDEALRYAVEGGAAPPARGS